MSQENVETNKQLSASELERLTGEPEKFVDLRRSVRELKDLLHALQSFEAEQDIKYMQQLTIKPELAGLPREKPDIEKDLQEAKAAIHELLDLGSEFKTFAQTVDITSIPAGSVSPEEITNLFERRGHNEETSLSYLRHATTLINTSYLNVSRLFSLAKAYGTEDFDMHDRLIEANESVARALESCRSIKDKLKM